LRPIGAGVEVRVRGGDVLAERAQGEPFVLLPDGVHGAQDDVARLGQRARGGRRRGRARLLGGRGLRRGAWAWARARAAEVLEEDEALADAAEGLGRLLLADAVDVEALLAMREASRVKSLSDETSTKPSKRPVCIRSMASMTRLMSEEFLPTV
jgi:hypothetical protein